MKLNKDKCHFLIASNTNDEVPIKEGEKQPRTQGFLPFLICEKAAPSRRSKKARSPGYEVGRKSNLKIS